MKEKLNQPKKLILPVILFISLSINLLYFFNVLNLKIFLIPSKSQEIQNQKMPNYIDSPIIKSRNLDSLKRLERIVRPNDSLRIKRQFQK
jgi:hypothetical protein